MRSCVTFLGLSVFLLAASVQESRAKESAMPIEGIVYSGTMNFYFYECGKIFLEEGDPLYDHWVLNWRDDALEMLFRVRRAADTSEGDETYISGTARLIYVEDHKDPMGHPTGADGVAYFESLSNASSSHDLIERCVKGPTGLLDGLK
jgi:hypothetical protein